MSISQALPFRVALISTGGTIEKTYDALSGVLSNRVSVLDLMLSRMEIPDLEINRISLMNKDSLDMTEEDHVAIARTALAMSAVYHGVIVVHGTDRLAESGERTIKLGGKPHCPIVFTGAMRPYELRSTDAVQNLTESLLAVRVLPAGVYVVMHNRVLAFPGVRKNRQTLQFEQISLGTESSDSEDV